MPEPYEVLNARVKQKINTEANWIAEEDTFGVIFEGEQAFVINEDGTPVNFKIGDGTKKFSELAYFIAYYSNITNQKVLPFIDKSANLTIPSVFRLNSFLTDIIFLNSGATALTLNIGTTDGGSELASISLDAGVSIIGLKKYFEGVETLYLTGLTGVSFSVYILYIQIDESPAIPPSGGGSFRWPKGFRGTFEPLYDGHENEVWDFTTGLGKPNTGYDNCALSGTNGTEDLGDFYEVGYLPGDTIGGVKGNGTNEVLLGQNNIPAFDVPLPNSSRNGRSDNANDRDVMIPTSQQYIRVGTENPDPINIRPNSKISLKFVAITD